MVCRAPHQSHPFWLRPAIVCMYRRNWPMKKRPSSRYWRLRCRRCAKTRIELGESVAVLGAGLVGILAMRLAQLSGGVPVVGIDLEQRRLDLAKQVGADEVLVSDDSLQDKLRAKLGADGADVVIELTGAPNAVVTAFQLAATRGRVVLAGSTRGISRRGQLLSRCAQKGTVGHRRA